jgi:Fe-S-cluster containining protein
MGPARLAELTELMASPPHFRFIRNAGHVCGALDTSEKGRYPCKIYEHRPEDCRIVEPGSPACLEARALGHLGSSLGFKRLS